MRSVERNDFKESQRMVSLMKFIGECYNFKVISTDCIFDIMYKLINYNMDTKSEDSYMK